MTVRSRFIFYFHVLFFLQLNETVIKIRLYEDNPHKISYVCRKVVTSKSLKHLGTENINNLLWASNLKANCGIFRRELIW